MGETVRNELQEKRTVSLQHRLSNPADHEKKKTRLTDFNVAVGKQSVAR